MPGIYWLTFHLKQTKQLRCEQHCIIFISYVPLHKICTSKAFAKWVAEILVKCGTNFTTFIAHMLR